MMDTTPLDVAAPMPLCSDIPVAQFFSNRSESTSIPVQEEESDWIPPSAKSSAFLAWAMGLLLLGGDLLMNMSITYSVPCTTVSCRLDRALVEGNPVFTITSLAVLFGCFWRQWRLREFASLQLKISEYEVVTDNFRHCGRCQHKSKQHHLCIYASNDMLSAAAAEFARKFDGEDLYVLMDEARIFLDRERVRAS